MKISTSLNSFLLCLVFVISSVSCKTQFEKIRTSNDPALILEQAHAFFEAEDYYKAQTLYELAIPNYRGKLEAEDIYFNFAYTHFNTRQYILAAHYFKNFANTFGNSPKKEEADYMTAFSHFKMSPNYKLDQSSSDKAIESFQLFMNSYPESERVAECNKLIEELRLKMELKAFDEGKLYYDLKRYSSATTSFSNMLKDFPETDKAPEVRYLIAKSSYLLAENSIYSKKQERFLETTERCNEFLKKHTGSKFQKEVVSYLENSQKEINKFTNGRS